MNTIADMHQQNIAGELRKIMADTFGVDENELPEGVSQATFARWTSLSHMVLLVALEEQFGVSFTMAEMASMTSLERIVEVLQIKHRSAAAIG